PPVAGVLKQEITFLVTGGVIPKLDIVLEVPARDEQVAVAVVIEIDQARSPGDLIESACAGPRDVGHILKNSSAQTTVKDCPLFLIGRHIEIESTIIVEVATFHTHGSQADSVAVVRQTREQADLLKVTRSVVPPDKIGHGIVA